ncbi:putative WD repeat-containing protein [Exophiala dermatitidis]|uniref:Cyclin-dependent kinase 8/11 n=1 Tax=Exophiala dermatitidis (strain ATCC 34100 / CBS 525.76 / NIH/UT8656) TaxID=858893 RepID=H6BZ57_EXODN|nr:cyclin-dependent kinase 8/11 [Exophiala dermatitidis NIH/UT8656]EHY56920.1 cyclin-dependent kinase 8/11 [Exophiala dermatitidis NIH/UT8656]
MDEIDEESLRHFVPASFGSSGGEFDPTAQIESVRRKVPGQSEADQTISAKSKDVRHDPDKDSDTDSDADSESDDSDYEDEFPTSHEIVFKTHDRAVTTIAVDPAGSRMITGSTDCTIKLHDFATMTPNTLRAFKSVDPTATKSSANSETHPVHVAKFNPNSPSQVLVVTATPQARILTRDGEMSVEFVKGDMYLRDMHMTKGHISEITSGTWHPHNYDLCVTAGTDSTLRIWDVNVRNKQRDVIVHKSKQAGSAGRTRMTAVAWGSQVEGGNTLLVAAALDGSLVMWGGEGPYNRPSAEISQAHASNTWTGGVDISPDGRLVITRGGDDTIKLWDTRKFKQPVNTTSHTSTSSQYPTSNIMFAPNASSVLTGSESGDLYILNPATLKPELVTPVTPGSALISVLWHEKLNQIITGSANAETHMLFNPKISTKGALMVMSKPPKRRHVDDDPSLTTDMSQGVSGDAIVNPGTSSEAIQGSTFASRHPTIGLTASGRSRDPRRPHIPASTPFARSQPDERHIKERIPLSSMREEDPREALLKYAEKAEKEPMFTNVWKKTQPKTIYAELSDDEEGGPQKKKQKN